MAKLYASRNPNVSELEVRNGERARTIGAEGMVLLKNNGTLPLTSGGKIALYGNGARRTIGGGTGSGSVNSREVINIEQGLETAGFEIITKDWINRDCDHVQKLRDAYNDRLRKSFQEIGMGALMMMFSDPFIEPSIIPVEDGDLHADETDTAVFVISRNSGEGKDRHDAPGEYELFAEEETALKKIAAAYSRTVVVLNVGGVIDLKAVLQTEGVGAILLMSQAGNYGGYALADILTGSITPSGHLTTTWPVNYQDTPMADTFSFNNADLDDEYYNEGIYVGYRYYDTFNVTPQFPFGFGLSYTSFEMETQAVTADEQQLTITEKVTNTGAVYSGRETVQIYVSAPSPGETVPDGISEAKLEKPYQELKGFVKTRELRPGESQEVTVTIPIRTLSSYDPERAAWILEAGTYYIRVGNSSRNTHIAARLFLPSEAITEQLRNRLQPDTALTLLSSKGVTPYSYPEEASEKETAPEITLDSSRIPTSSVTYSNSPIEIPASEKSGKITMDDIRSGKATLDELISQLTPEEMAVLCVGTERAGGGGPQIGASSAACPGAAGDTTSLLLKDRGVRNLILADGPAGLRLTPHFVTDANDNILPSGVPFADLEPILQLQKPEYPADKKDYYQYTTAIPIATLLAQTWDEQAVEDAGDIVGAEMEEFGVDLWLAPGMNIHRSPLCGRNFEYYSEDPLIAGKCAAADTRGVQKHKSAGTTIKHFACNNQEDNRNHVNSHVDERTLREIYLKGFEIAVKESQPKAIMTSYNLVNGEHSANNHDLLTFIARDEWGFQGLVMTDWGTTGGPGAPGDDGTQKPAFKYGDSYASGCIKAGNDLTMPGGQPDVDDILNALGKKEGEIPYPLTLAELQAAAKHILNVILTMQR